MAAQPESNPNGLDSLTVPVCGNLHEYTEQNQARYHEHNSGNPSFKNLEDYDPAAVVQCGSFTVCFEDIDINLGEGFDDPIEGLDRRNTLCAVLNYVETVLDLAPGANPIIVVDPSYTASNPAPIGTFFLAQAGPMMSQATGNHYGVDPGIFNGHFANYIQTGLDPDPDTDVDAVLRVNFDKLYVRETIDDEWEFIFAWYFNVNDPLQDFPYFDLFTVLLHETTHMLGVISGMNEDLEDPDHPIESYHNSNGFTRYDWTFGFYGDIETVPFSGLKLVVGSENSPHVNASVNQISNPLRRSNVYLYDSGAPKNHNMFAGTFVAPTVNDELLSGSFLSHLNGIFGYRFSFRQQFSPGKYMRYVMDPAIGLQQVTRAWTLPEIRLLRELDYVLSPSFLAGTSLSPPFSNAQVVDNSPPYRTDYSDSEQRIDATVSSSVNTFLENSPADFVLTNSNTSTTPGASVLVMNIDLDNTLTDDDGDDIYVRPEMVFGIRGVSNNGNNHDRVDLSPDGKVFTYTPAPGYHGRAEFGFFLTDGKEIGAMEVYTIDVELDNQILWPASQEMILNGTFEDGREVRTWEEPQKIFSTAFGSYSDYQINFGALGAGGGHPYSNHFDATRVLHSLDATPYPYPYTLINNGFGIYGGLVGQTSPTEYGLWAPYPSTVPSDNLRFTQSRNMISTLVKPLEPGEHYVLKIDLGPIQPFNAMGQSLTNLEIQVISDLATDGSFNVLQNLSHDFQVDIVLDSQTQAEWQHEEIRFQYCGTEPAPYLYVNFNPGLLYTDNLSLKVDPDPPVLSVDAGPDIVISDCPYGGFDPEVFNPGCDMAYSWTPTNGLNNPNILNPFPEPSETTTYTLTVTDLSNGNTASDEVTVYVTNSISYQEIISVCITGEPIDLMGYVSPQGGVFSGPGLTGSIFDPAAVGSGLYNITYQLYQSCLDPVTFIVTVGGYDASSASHPNGLHVYPGDANDGGTLTGNFQFLDHLVIHDGATFNLDYADLVFIEGIGVKILPGGQLNISNSLLSTMLCANHWRGIYVYGNKNFSQTGQDALEQGRLYIDNSTVQNALTGVTNFGSPASNATNTGGIIHAIYTTFRDCRISAQIQNYQNIPNGNLQPIKTDFVNCTFLWTTNFQFADATANPMVRLRHVYRVKFRGCEFLNSSADLFSTPNNHYEKAAVFCNQASIDLSKGCNGYPPYALDTQGNCVGGNKASVVLGLNYGFVFRDGSGSAVTHTAFNCYRAVWDYKSTNFRLTQNTFEKLPSSLEPYSGQPDPSGGPVWNVPYGAYFERASGYWIEGNTFNIESQTPATGLFVRNSGPEHNQVYRNTFTDNQYGIVAYDQNRGPNPLKGLKILCNTYKGNTIDNVTWSTVSNPPSNFGISQYQGAPPSLNDPDGQSAGNKFLDQPLYNVYNTLDWVNYYYHTSENLTSTYGVTPIPDNFANSCPSGFGNPQQGLSEKQARANQTESEADNIGAVLDAIIDGGNTEALTTEVILADFGDAVELYYDLMQESPTLSKEVMIEAIQKEYELPAQLLTLVLNANPHAAKLSDIQRKLDERVQQLAANQRALIDEGLDMTSYKEGLEARRSRAEASANMLIDQIISEVLADTTASDKTQMLEGYTGGFETPTRLYLVADLLVLEGKFAAAQNKLGSLDASSLTPEQVADHADYETVFGIRLDLLSSGDSLLSPATFQTLEDITFNSPNSMASALATVLLEAYGGEDFHEVLIEPDWQSKANTARHGGYKASKIVQCKVYPNPTEGALIVEVPTPFEKIFWQLIANDGRILLEEPLMRGTTGLATINLQNFASGTYTLHLRDDSGILDEIHRLSLVK